MSEMSHDQFRAACDALSDKVDPEQFERFRWTRDEAPKLVRLVELVRGSVEDRTDIEINEEGGDQTTKRFVIKVHGQRIAGLGVALSKGHAVVSVGPIERSAFTVAEGKPIHTKYANVDEAWIGEALGQLMALIRKPAPKPAPSTEVSDEAQAQDRDARDT